jgi:hypothetical protein
MHLIEASEADMKAAGFFRELPHGLPSGDAIFDAERDALGPDERATVAAYLRGCHVIAATSVLADDVLDPSLKAVSPISVHTDGESVWPEDFAYYVETYGISPPTALLERAMHNDPPAVPSTRCDDIIAWMQQGMPRES